MVTSVRERDETTSRRDDDDAERVRARRTLGPF
jgi:hypothetical protein